jgi:hypothetical protein
MYTLYIFLNPISQFSWQWRYHVFPSRLESNSLEITKLSEMDVILISPRQVVLDLCLNTVNLFLRACLPAIHRRKHISYMVTQFFWTAVRKSWWIYTWVPMSTASKRTPVTQADVNSSVGNAKVSCVFLRSGQKRVIAHFRLTVPTWNMSHLS